MVLKPGEEAALWNPESDTERKLVREELNSILASPHFRNSKRYPSLLRYVVEKTLDGQADQLKERTLGVEVFERCPDYDTNADPVVRFSASEVRKRIAQHYHESEGQSAIQIELPLGSYAAQFKLRMPAQPTPMEMAELYNSHEAELLGVPVSLNGLPGSRHESQKTNSAAPLAFKIQSKPKLVAALLFIVLLCGGAFALFKSLHPRQVEHLWGPLLQTSGPVLICAGTTQMQLVTPEPPDTSLLNHIIGPYHHISVPSAIAISRITGVLQANGKSYLIKEAPESSLTDLHERPVVLVGALNNVWTMRLMDSLRYRFAPGTKEYILDRQNPQMLEWVLDTSKPFSSITRDYAIVARYRDGTTNGPVLVIAGLGPYGTEAASVFVSSPQYIEQVAHLVQGDLKNENLEMVLRTDVIAGEAGPPYLVAATSF